MKQLKVIGTSYSFYVERDDAMYDKKGGFKTYKEASHYRSECQRGWINHMDYVFLVEDTIYEGDQVSRTYYNLTLMDNPKAFLEKKGLCANY